MRRIFTILAIWICAASALSAHGRVIRILAIGNSFSADAIEQYLYELALEAGDTLVIGTAYRGAQGFESHWKVAEQDKSDFEYHKIVRGQMTNHRKTLQECVADEAWDYITFQQVSQDSGDYSTYEPWLTRLLDYVKRLATNPEVKYALHRTWAYSQDSGHGGFARYGKDQTSMFGKIVEATRSAMEAHKEFSLLIPAGTAIQNGRTSFVGDRFNRDGYHLSYGLGRYTAACTWFEAITGHNVLKSKYKPAGVSNDEAQVAREAAHYAVRHPDSVTGITCGKVVMTNPLNLNYRFQTDGVCRREAADPVIVFFKDRYYLFASHSSGYWHSPNLRDWTYVQTRTLKAVEVWAPAVLSYKGALYYLGMGEKRIFRSVNPAADEWEELAVDLPGLGDPAFFQDDDGRVYLYYGCSDSAPIRGMEVDPENGFRPLGPAVDLIPHRSERFGWEVFGERNEQLDRKGWNEAPCITRQGDCYYLMYAAPGTEFTTYCTGVYVSKNPLGPYTCMPGAPFATKAGGFVRGAGHGHPFKDRYGNDWYVATVVMASREHFERRIGIFPAYYQDGRAHAITDYMDFPFVVPDKRVDFSSCSVSAGLNLLSYGKQTSASSSVPEHPASRATDEDVRTWWSAATGRKGEWLQMDLGRPMSVSALQVSFSDEGFQTYRRDKDVPVYQYVAEYSTDGKDWKMLVDRSGNTADQIYELVLLESPVEARFVRVRNTQDFPVGKFSIADLRLFGKAAGKAPRRVSGFTATRKSDKRRIEFAWDEQPRAEGYVIRWGVAPGCLDNAVMVRGEAAEFGFFDRDLSYYFSIEAFNECGQSKACKPVHVK